MLPANMPAPLDVDHEAVKVLAIAVGVRQAARQMGLPEDAVRQWSKRENWFPEPQKQVLPPTMQKQTVTGVTKASDALANTLADDSKMSRLHASRAIRKGFEHLAEQSGEAIMAQAPNVASLAKAASTVHGWADGQQQTLRVSIYRGGDEPPVIDV